jgi:Fuc2NAc and GlcNAc transferase
MIGLPGAGLLLAATLLVSFVLTGRVRRYAQERLLDVPNARSSHSEPTPRGGGLAVVLAFAPAVAVLFRVGGISFGDMMALSGGLAVAGIGFWDDHRHVPAGWRMAAHFAAAAWALCWLGGISQLAMDGQYLVLGWLGSAIAVIFIVWMLNLFNFMDGIDGIAGAETVFVATAAAGLLLLGPGEGRHALPLGVLAFAVAGFLIWNWPPAKIFMGDVGSGYLGFLLGVFAVLTAITRELSLVVWLILSGVFFVDATFTLLRRISSGQRWYDAHRSHAYQRAAVLLAGHKRVTLGVLLIDGFWLLPWGCAAVFWPHLELWFLLVAYMPLICLAFLLDAGKAT